MDIKLYGSFKINFDTENYGRTYTIVDDINNSGDDKIYYKAKLAQLVYNTAIGQTISLENGEKVLVIDKNMSQYDESQYYLNKETDNMLYNSHIKDNKYNYLVDYYPKYLNYEHKYSEKIIDLKNGSLDAIQMFTNFLHKHINNYITKNSDKYTICVIPGHNAKNINDSGIVGIAKELVKRFYIVDGTQVLIRTKDVQSKHSPNSNRGIDSELQSIQVKEIDKIVGRTIFLLDDVVTTGNSMKANEKLLLGQGAKKVIYISIGRTKRWV